MPLRRAQIARFKRVAFCLFARRKYDLRAFVFVFRRLENKRGRKHFAVFVNFIAQNFFGCPRCSYFQIFHCFFVVLVYLRAGNPTVSRPKIRCFQMICAVTMPLSRR